MFERMTERARRAVVLAQEEATRLGHGYVGTEHLLFGLLRAGDEPTTTTLLHSVRMDDFEAMYQRVVAPSDEARSHLQRTSRSPLR